MPPALVMHLHLGRHIEQWMEHGSYFVLFALLFSCGLGLPLPEDIPLILAGALAGQGKMNLALAAVCGWCGILGGDIVLYHLGRKFGLEVRRLPLIGRHLSQKRIDRVHALFERFGVGVVAVGRMFAGIRGAMVVVAGAIRFTFWKFLLADGLAAVVSGGIFLMLGYWFSSNIKLLREHVEVGKKWAAVVVLIIAAGIAVWVYLQQRRERARLQSQDTPVAVPNDQPGPV